MKRLSMLLVLVAALSPVVFAQENGLNHGEFGVYIDYFRLRDVASANFWGLGARAGFNVHKYTQFEADVSYDFGRSVNEGFTPGTGFVSTGPGTISTGPVTFGRSGLRILHGLFGPKFQAAGRFRPFLALKGGFIDFRFNDVPVTFGTFTSSLNNVRSDNVNGVFYPSVGIETFVGPVGLRLEGGDEMYFSDSAHHNLRLSFGPQIRF
jgi:hypothetical protein